MKLAIPSETADGLASMRSGHFGHTPYFTIVEYDENMNIVGAEPVKNVDHDQFGCGGVIQYVLTLGVDGILTAGMGMPPFMRFTEAGIDVYVDRSHAYAKDALDLFCEGQLPRMTLDDACRH